MRFIVLVAVLIVFSVAPVRADPATTVIPTQHDFATLVKRLDAAVKANGMFVVTRASASIGAARRGVTIPGNMIVGVYRNDFAVRMLEASVPAGIEAPIRFYLTEEKDGTASLRYRSPSAVFGAYDGGARLKALGRELDAIFTKIAADATAD